MTTLNKPPSTQPMEGTGQTSHPDEAPSSSPPLAANHDPTKPEVTYASGKATRHLPGFSLVGMPEVTIRRPALRILKNREQAANSASATPASTSAKVTGTPATPAAGNVAMVAEAEPTRSVPPIAPPTSSTPTSASSTVPFIYRGSEPSSPPGSVLSPTLLSDVAKQIFDAAKENTHKQF